jgi:cytidylate kinase
MTLVALSASYGAGGSRIGPAVAERLGVSFVDRAIPMAVAARLDVPLDDAAAHDQQATGNWVERVLRGFIGSDTGAATPLPAETFSAEDFRRATEEVLLEQAATGNGVILGRGAVIVLRKHPGVLRVRLDGPAERRVRQAMELGGVDEATAVESLRQLDRTHTTYVKRFYGIELGDPSLYHLMIDSTTVSIDACTELIVTAARSLAAAPVAEGSES